MKLRDLIDVLNDHRVDLMDAEVNEINGNAIQIALVGLPKSALGDCARQLLAEQDQEREETGREKFGH